MICEVCTDWDFIPAREVLGLSKEKDVRLVLEEDGSEVQDDAAFLAGRTFLLLKKGECWRCREWIDFDSGTYPLYTDFKTSRFDLKRRAVFSPGPAARCSFGLKACCLLSAAKDW